MTSDKKRPLAIGDVIRFSGGLSMTPKAEAGYFARRVKARVLEADTPGELEIEVVAGPGIGIRGSISTRQVVSRLRRKEKRAPKEERGRFEAKIINWWHESKGSVGDITLAAFQGFRDIPPNSRLVELRSGETICPPGSVAVSREKLAEALGKAAAADRGTHAVADWLLKELTNELGLEKP